MRGGFLCLISRVLTQKEPTSKAGIGSLCEAWHGLLLVRL